MSEKIAIKGKSIVKKIAPLALATVITLGITGCGNNTTPTKSSNSINPTTSTTASTTQSATSSNSGDIKQYSQILQNVLTDSYYDEVIKSTSDRWGRPCTFKQGVQAIPYNFLAKQGLNISAIKNDEVDGFSTSYIKENDKNSLYVSVKVEHKATEPYYSCYVLKYPINKQEYNDYIMLHKNEYIQAPLFVQELDKQKTPEIISNINITTESLEKFKTSISQWDDLSTNAFNTTDLAFDIIKIEEIKNTYNHNIYIDIRNNSWEFIEEGKQKTAILTTKAIAGVSINNNIYSVFEPGISTISNLEEYSNTSENITMFNANSDYMYNLEK